jgi:hypothetical protein
MKDLHDTCLEIENQLPLWVGGDLEPEVQTTVEGHLALCERCRGAGLRAREARRALERGLRIGTDAMGVGPDPWPALRTALREEGLVGHAGAARSTITTSRMRRWNFAWPVAAAVLVGLFLAGTWLPSGSLPDQPAAQVEHARGRAGLPRGASTVPSPDDALAGVETDPVTAEPAGLRRLAPGELRLRDGALVYRSPERIDPDGSRVDGRLRSDASRWATPVGSSASPVSLEQVQLLPPR